MEDTRIDQLLSLNIMFLFLLNLLLNLQNLKHISLALHGSALVWVARTYRSARFYFDGELLLLKVLERE